ncbi:hypothetical protein B0H14DRAFT_2625555 [Mycena olivaceomarginata]|nr:hypothetical protein B0H14DRAFT_2625555 [Mycena olivaceomarginata]
MKRSNDGTDKKNNKKRAKNVYSLQSFGHSLKVSNTVHTAKLTADGRRADIRLKINVLCLRIAPWSDFCSLRRRAKLVGVPDLLRGITYGPIRLSGLYVFPVFRPSGLFQHGYNKDIQVDDEPSVDRRPPRKRKWYATTDDNLRHWVANYRDQYLRVLVTREGLLGEEQSCSCGQPASYRCSDCFGAQMFCCECLLEGHRLRPLCRIEAWNGTFFDHRDLRQLGLQVQLGHSDNRVCPHAHPGREKFIVIAPNGFHSVAVDFCQCRRSGSQSHWEQLLSYGWYPVTPDNPQSAITIAALKLFHAVSLQGKTTAYHFFNALAKITDNTGSNAFKCWYQLALRVVRQWRNLRALKRGGMGNDPDRRTAETREGELAIECLACPKAGVNLPEGWEKAPVEARFLYCIFLAIDACFCVKRKKISSWLADPSIQDGWAYFTRSILYGEFVETLGEQKEMSTCTGLAALDHANTKYVQGYAATGCGMITCGRHEIVCKNGVGDLQAGEKYGNMDYIVASAWRHLRDLLFFLLSYDIMCQWLAHYFVKFVIPKLHILGHLRFCQDFFSLLYTLGSAQADMEGIERIWSSSGLMGASTREMGPGSRQDTLDDFWHYWNWNKVVGMGTTLRSQLLKARKELTRQEEGLQEFTAAQEAEAPAWKEAVDAFEARATTDNPYQLPHAGPMLRDVELELTREEQEHERSTSTVLNAADDTMTEYLMLGLEIEGQHLCIRRQLAADLLANRHPTSKELMDFITRRMRVLRQIKKLRLMQRTYSPGALQRLATAEDPVEPAESEHAPLFLPSGLSPAQAAAPLSVPGLALAEARLRDGQCSESLEAIRHGLTVKKRLQTYKTLNSHRQHQNTRSRTLCSWCALEKGDLRLPEDEEEARRRKQRAMKGKRKEAAQVNENGEVWGVPGMGEKNRLISWIWHGAGSIKGTVGEAMHASVRVEWLKVYAQVKRWHEEARLLQEEMVRCLLTLEWQAARWDERAVSTHYRGRISYSGPHLQGAMALAARQAAVRRKLACRFRRCWWWLSDRVAQPGAGDSGQSSAEDGDEDWEEEGPVAGTVDPGESSARATERAEEGEEEEEEEECAEDEGEGAADTERRQAEMDELLAIQSTSLGQYNEV